MNSDDFCARMNVLIDLAGGPSELARKSRLSRRVIDKYKSGESDPSRSRLVALATAAGVSLSWLATGNGPMRDADPVATIRPAIGPVRGVPIYDAALSLGPGATNGDAHPIGDLDLPETYLHDVLRCKPGSAVAVYMRGDSMSPTLLDRDLAIIDTSVTTIERDDIYAFVLEGEGYIKRLQRAGGTVIVHSDNPSYSDWSIDGARLRDLRVIGRIAGSIRRHD
jgi:phage repressor protein C with HTH and peptisase S24 domain